MSDSDCRHAAWASCHAIRTPQCSHAVQAVYLQAEHGQVLSGGAAHFMLGLGTVGGTEVTVAALVVQMRCVWGGAVHAVLDGHEGDLVTFGTGAVGYATWVCVPVSHGEAPVTSSHLYALITYHCSGLHATV